jgi:hypothetical protein
MLTNTTFFFQGVFDFFDKEKRDFRKLQKISVKRPLQIEEVCKLADLDISKLFIVNEFTLIEEKLISLLQESLKKLIFQERLLIVVEDLDLIPKEIWEYFFVMSNDDLKRIICRHGATIENPEDSEVSLTFFLRNYTAHLGNERYEKIK